MKILTVIASLAPRYGGPAKSCPELAQALARRGHDISIYTTNWDGDGELSAVLGQPVLQSGVKISYFPIQRPRFWAFSLPLGQALCRNVPTFDIVHVYSLYFFHALATRHYCCKYGVPFVIQPHGTMDPFLYKHHRMRKAVAEFLYENKNIRSAAAIIYNSEEEGVLAKGAVRGRPSLVVPGGIDLKDYSELLARGRFRARYPETQDKKLLLFLSRINFKKGLDILVDAFSRLSKTRDDVHLILAGPDNEGYAQQVRQWCDRLGISARVTMTGMLSEADKLAALTDADLFVLPSYTENFGTVILEAMACAVPVIISDKVNTWREIEAAGAGKVTRCDAGEVAEAMADLLNHPDQAKQMGENGRALVRRRFQWDQVALQQEQAYETVLRQNNFSLPASRLVSEPTGKY